MKKQILALALVVSFTGATLAASHADQTTKPTMPKAALSAITDNAHAAQNNAAIYQWARVNREVDRIVGDANKVEKALASDPAFAKRLADFKQAVSALRAARLAHSVDRMNETTRQVLSATAEIMKG